MKKLTFLLAMVLAVSFAMAQKTTTLVQSGVSNVADVYQAGNSWNDIFATQSGNGNVLTAEQIGFDNYLSADQEGNNNTISSSQEGAQNIVDSWQDGNGNFLKSDQTGAFNELFSEQVGNFNTVKSDQTGAYNEVESDQLGNDNTLRVNQYGLDNNIDLLQDGKRNKAVMEQLTQDYSITHGYNTSTVEQSGKDNKATLSQMETDGDADDGWFWGTIPERDRSINLATATQSGNQNSYKLTQGRQTDIPNNTSYLNQSGKENKADIDQVGYQNWSSINQSGNLNKADLLQSGNDGYVAFAGTPFDESYSWQTGKENKLNVKQTGDVNHQLAESTQDGRDNKTKILQVGTTTQNVNAWLAGSSDVIDVDQIDNE